MALQIVTDTIEIVTEDITTKAEFNAHVNNSEIHTTVEEKNKWNEKDIFISEYNTVTYAEIDTAYKAGKSCFIKIQQIEPVNLTITLPLTYIGDNKYYFSTYIYSNNSIYTAYISSDDSKNSGIYTLPPTTSDNDNGKVLKVKNGFPKWIDIKPIITTTTLLASNWDLAAKTYSFETDYPSANYNIEVDINGDSCTDEQLEAWIAAKPLSSPTNKINAKGDVPTVDIPIILTVTPK